MGSADTPTVVIIPALNEASSLPLVLADLAEIPRTQIIVVDNGSTDETAELARRSGAYVVVECQRGYGAAMLRGLAELRDHRDETIVVFLDADYSDSPDRLPQLIQPIVENHADFVVGSRELGEREPGAFPAHARWGNWLACTLMRFTTGVRYTDLGPFRAIRLGALRRLSMVDENYGWTIEMQIKAAQMGLKIVEIPVPYRRRIGVSKISGTLRGSLAAGYKILFTVAKYARRRPRPSDAINAKRTR